MNFDERYKNDFKIIKNLLQGSGESGSEAVIAGILGKGKTFFTDRDRNNKKFTKEDLVWLHYNYGHLLENPIVKNVQVSEKDNKSGVQGGVSSGKRDQVPLSGIERILSDQAECLKRLSELSMKATEEIDTLKLLLMGKVLADTGGKKNRAGKGRDGS